MLQCNWKPDLISGGRTVGLMYVLSVKCIALLLGNDLAGDKVISNPLAYKKPSTEDDFENLEDNISDIFHRVNEDSNSKRQSSGRAWVEEGMNGGCAVNGCVCPRIYQPVCSSLGNSYANGCTLTCFTNPPGTGQYMTDKHYKILMDLFIEERQTRVHLEDFVTQLQKELVQTQTALGNKLHALNKENNTIEQYVKELKNKTEVLDNRLLDVESENIQLKMELNSLRKNHSVLEVQYNQIKQNHATFENKTRYFETEIQSLKQLKSVADLQAVFRISNQTDHLEHELQIRTVKLLFYNLVTMHGNWNIARLKYHNNYILAAVSLYPIDKDYSSGSTIMFTSLRTSNGLNSTRLADIRNKGYFTCDKDGLYWISISIVTHTASGQVHLYKNSKLMNVINLQHETSDELTTFASLERLSISDIIIAKAGTKVGIHGNQYSVLSVFQLTT
ncbi:unnamed protein product [Mytilus coruscus]|uniref:Kazal-like domain-containing protein n=1 Tax=Mytilus coruscus TaxID=42192 RepID=A0A6J8C2Z5_MYTCO|nr:unnamed protein product [Mytilus coruscus]